jgi:UDP-glucose 4,6-dehydratase
VYNIGTDFEISNMDLSLKLLEKFGFADRAKEFIQYFEDRPFNDIRYHIDTSKLLKLGWKPKVEFGFGLDKTST